DLPEQKQRPALTYNPTHAEGMRAHGAQVVRCTHLRNEIVRDLRAALVVASVRDELASAVTKLTELQPAAGDVEEGVDLRQVSARDSAQRFQSPPNRGEIGGTRLDFDVPRHQGLSSGAVKSSVSMPFARVHCTRRTRSRSPCSGCTYNRI